VGLDVVLRRIIVQIDTALRPKAATKPRTCSIRIVQKDLLRPEFQNVGQFGHEVLG
jgi:hypothetical protein